MRRLEEKGIAACVGVREREREGTAAGVDVRERERESAAAGVGGMKCAWAWLLYGVGCSVEQVRDAHAMGGGTFVKN